MFVSCGCCAVQLIGLLGGFTMFRPALNLFCAAQGAPPVRCLPALTYLLVSCRYYRKLDRSCDVVVPDDGILALQGLLQDFRVPNVSSGVSAMCRHMAYPIAAFAQRIPYCGGALDYHRWRMQLLNFFRPVIF